MDLNEFRKAFDNFTKENIEDLKDVYHSEEGRPDDLAMANVMDAINYEVQNGNDLAKLLFKAYIDGLEKTPGLHTLKYREYVYPSGATYRLAIYDNDLEAEVGDEIEITYLNEGMKYPKDFWIKVTDRIEDKIVGRIGELEVRFMDDNIKNKNKFK